MGLFSGIGNFLGGIFGDSEAEKKKKQQQQAAQQKQAQNRAQAPGTVVLPNRPQTTDNGQQVPTVVKTPDNGVNLSFLQKTDAPQKMVPKAGTFVPDAPVTKVSTPAKQDLRSVKQHAIDIAKDVPGVAAGTALGATRMAEGVVQGITEAPAQLLHLGHFLGDKISGEKTDPEWLKKVDKANETIQRPMKWVGKKTDEAAAAYGDSSQSIYKPAQVAANVAAIVPAAAEIGGALATKAGAAPKVVAGFKTVGGQAKTPTIDAMIGRNKPGVPPVVEPPKTSVAPGVNSTNPTMAEDAQAVLNQRAAAQAELDAQAAAQAAEDAPKPAPTFSERLQNNMSDKIAETQRTPDIQDINDSLRNNASRLAATPEMQGAIQTAYHETGGQNSLSLIMHSLSKTTDKAAVRSVVSKLVPDADPNTLNRAVNSITGADDVGEIAHALTEAGSRSVTKPLAPFGPLSDAPAPMPAPAAVADEFAPPQKMPTSSEIQRPTATSGDTLPVFPEPVQTPIETPQLPARPVETPSISRPVASPNESGPLNSPVIDNADNVSQSATNVNIQPGDTTAKAAPNLRKALLKDLGDADGEIKKGAPDREVLNLEELRQKAANAVRGVPKDDLVRSYLVSPDEIPTLIKTAQDYALGRAALDVLYDLGKQGDVDAITAASNILDAMGQGAGKSAQFLRATQEAFHSMPIQMKISKTINRLKKINADKYGADSPQVSRFDDPAERNAIEAQFDAIFNEDQGLRTQIANVDATIAKGVTDPAAVTTQELKAAGKLKKQLDEKLRLSDNRFAETYDKFTPGQSVTDKIGDWQRTAMLSAPTGRVADVVTTGINIAHTAVDQLAEAGAGRLLNAGRKIMGKAPGKYIDTGMSPKALIKAVPDALRKTKLELQGKGQVSDKADIVRGQAGMGNRSDIVGNPKGKLTRLVKAGTNFATHLSEGVANSEIKRLAVQEAKQKGLRGEDAEKFVLSRQYAPTADVASKARLAHEAVNNLNDNRVTQGFRKIGDAMETIGGPKVGKLFKNAILPFPTWLGGNIWNSVTDKNIIAATIKFGKALKQGDAQVAVKEFTKAGVQGTGLFAAGYQLTEQGILTDKDANGNSYEGTYIHIGDRYMPVTALGFAAPNLILGNIAHRAFNDEGGDKDSFGKNLLQMAEKGIGPVVKAFSINQITGGDNNLSRGISNVTGNNDSPEKMTDTVVNTGSQFVPSALRDVNAILNNYTGLNPTKEKSDTAVTGADGKKDYFHTGLQKAKDLVPVVSQSLPRKADVAAPDLFDRTVRGNRDTPGGKQAKADAQVVVDRSKDFKARGIPDFKVKDFDTIVKARFENGDYASAIEGLQAKLDDQKNNKDIPASTNKKIEDQIKLYQVHKDGNFKPETAATYSSTSLTEWRDMGDPESDTYNPDAYEALYKYDTALADKGISGSTLSKDEHKFTAKKEGTGSGSSRKSAADKAADAELSRIKSNTLGDMPTLSKVSLGDLRPEKVSTPKMATLQQIRSSDLVKKRKISVNKA